MLRRAIAIKDKVPPEFITQAKMAKDAGVTTNAWNNYERDPLARIGIDSARALKRIYGVSLDWIYEGPRAPPACRAHPARTLDHR